MKFLKIFIVLLCFCFTSLIAFGEINSNESSKKNNELINELTHIIPDKPTYIANIEQIEILKKSGATKRIDCAYLLIKALAFSFDPNQSDETYSKIDMFPAIIVIRENYGDSIAPILFSVGIETEKEWLRKRIAFTIKKVCSKSKVIEMIQVFSLEDSKNNNSGILLALLSEESIDIDLNYIQKNEMDSIDKALRNIKKKQIYIKGQVLKCEISFY